MPRRRLRATALLPLPLPELLPLNAHLLGHRVGLDELRGRLHEAEELDEVLAVDEQARLADLARLVVPLPLREHEVVVSVGCPLHLGGVGARADRLEELLEQDLVVVRCRPTAGRLARVAMTATAAGRTR